MTQVLRCTWAWIRGHVTRRELCDCILTQRCIMIIQTLRRLKMEKKAQYTSKAMRKRHEALKLEIADTIQDLDEEELRTLELFVEFLIWRRNR